MARQFVGKTSWILVKTRGENMVALRMFRIQDAERSHALTFGLVALALAAAVFYIDTLTNIEGAISVLYVVATLLASQVTTRIGLIAIASLFAVLALISYGITHSAHVDLQSIVRLIVALAALFVTTMLLLKTETARLTLLSINVTLKESEARYRSIFDRARVALWERDYSLLREHLLNLKTQGFGDIKAYAESHPLFIDNCVSLIKVVASNEAARELFGEEAAAAGAWRQSTIPGQEKFLDLLQVIMDGGRIFEEKVRARADNGEDKLVLLSISFPDDPAAFTRVVVSMVDVTQRELALQVLAQARTELAKASKAATVGALSASLAHELNQPLGAIAVNAQTLLRWVDRDPPDLEAVRRSADRIIRDSQRASEIIQNTRGLLAHSSSKPEPIDLADVIDETLALMEHELQRSGTKVSVKRKKLPAVTAVKIEIQQVLINLITNAIQAMDEAVSTERLITLETGQPDTDCICLAVRDSGPGINEDVREKLFAPFFTTKATGLGMGLSICRSTLEARRGRLDCNNHPDGGAVFEMHLLIKPEIEDV
ncbi:Nodulation protein V [Neorhizobium galegae bv. orientalis]|nr:Nodulation protein V [Neorhizobium galegae bv. orientalis]